MNKYIILLFILICILCYILSKNLEGFTLRKKKVEILDEINKNSGCNDRFDKCFDGNLYTPPDSSGQIYSETQTDCDNPLNQEAEARMWLNCCNTCNKKVKNTPRMSVCKDFLGKDENKNSYCKKKVKEFGCNTLLDIVCCNSCSKVNRPRFVIDKNIKINDNLVLHRNNFSENTDINNQIKGVLDYVSPTNFKTSRRDETADVFIKERNYSGNYLSYLENKKPAVYLDSVKLDGDILQEILKFRGPYLVPFNPNPNSEQDFDTIHKYNLYDTDQKYEKLCFDNRKSSDGNDICLDPSHLKMLNGERDVKIKNIKDQCLGYNTNNKFQLAGYNKHNSWLPPNSKDVSNTLFFDTCGDVSTNRFKFEDIKEIDSKLIIRK